MVWLRKLISLAYVTSKQAISKPDIYTGVGLQIVFHISSCSVKESLWFTIIVDHLDHYGTEG